MNSLIRPDLPTPPRAERRSHVHSEHGHERPDPYFWLRDRDDEGVLAHLRAENAYTQSVLAPTQSLQEALYREMRGRIKEDDDSAPYRLDNYFYYHRFETGREYPIYCRKHGSLEAKEEVTLDVNAVADGHAYCAVSGGDKVSPDHNYLAYAVDTVSRRIYNLYIKDLRTGELLPDRIPHMTGNAVWAADNQTIFYSRQHPDTLRSYRIYRHRLGTPPEQDELIFEEENEAFITYVTKSKSREYLIISSHSTSTHEARVLRADDPGGSFRLFAPRRQGDEYDIDHADGFFYVRSNLDAPNFQLLRCPEDQTERTHWEAVIPHREEVLLENFELFDGWMALQERRDGLSRIRLRTEARDFELPFAESAFVASLGYNPEYQISTLRYHYQSMSTPPSVYRYDTASGETELLKETPVLGGFDRNNYRSERQWATAEDGTRVPISVVYRVDTPLDGSAPLLLYGYGSYGISMEPSFSGNRLSLLDRGFVYAIAHIRGGEEMGRHWYENGKLGHKQNTFTDFIACAEHLIATKYANPNRLCAMGGSAGGLLMGAVVNLRPDLFHAVVAAVPFVDVVTTMLDDSIPLTTGEYEEWGNPNEREAFEYILSYSPYDQVREQPYPHMLVTTGYHDSQVQYWEPAKWVARLRDHNTRDSLILLHTNLEVGHGGASGRFERLKELARDFAFLLAL